MTKKALYLKVIGPVFITKPEFAKFLSKNLTKKFTRFDPGACPLAIASGCIVTSHEYVPGAKVKGEYVEEGQMQMLPKWASRFVYRVDSDGDKSIIMAPIIAFGVMAWGAVVVFILALLGYIK